MATCAGGAQAFALQIHLADAVGEGHDTPPVRAMGQAVSVPQFVDSFLNSSGKEKFIVFVFSVKRGPQASERNDRRLSPEMGLPEDEVQAGNIEIDVSHPDDFPRVEETLA